jgi:DNA-nicking Smr family endonuclease
MSPPAKTSARSPRLALADLRRLHDEMAKAAREAARLDAEARERRLAADRERRVFELTVGPVEPIKGRVGGTATRPWRARPEPIARQRALDEAEALREAWSDGFDAETLLDTDEALGWRRHGIGVDVVQRLRRGVWAIQAHCDLHGLRRDDAREVLATFLRDAVRAGKRCVRIVHGKGNGSPGRTPVLKGKVRHWLMQKSEVLAFTQARAADGGHGALLVLLQPTRTARAEPGSAAAPPAEPSAVQAPARLRIQSAVPKKA